MNLRGWRLWWKAKAPTRDGTVERKAAPANGSSPRSRTGRSVGVEGQLKRTGRGGRSLSERWVGLGLGGLPGCGDCQGVGGLFEGVRRATAVGGEEMKDERKETGLEGVLHTVWA